MCEIEVKIVKLDPMRMLSAYGFGAEPENAAWEKLKAFVLKNKLLAEAESPLTYGFNNPNPSEGSPNYGYEIWFPIEKDVQPEGDLRIIGFQGGLYAVTTFKGLQNIGEVWGRLVKWRESSPYKPGSHQWLEKLNTWPDLPPEEFVFDLYLPIRE